MYVFILLLDVNECSLTNGPCQQNQCYNTRGSYQCLPSSCPQQYHQVGGGYVTEVVPSFLERSPMILRSVTVVAGRVFLADILS